MASSSFWTQQVVACLTCVNLDCAKLPDVSGHTVNLDAVGERERAPHGHAVCCGHDAPNSWLGGQRLQQLDADDRGVNAQLKCAHVCVLRQPHAPLDLRLARRGGRTSSRWRWGTATKGSVLPAMTYPKRLRGPTGPTPLCHNMAPRAETWLMCPWGYGLTDGPTPTMLALSTPPHLRLEAHAWLLAPQQLVPVARHAVEVEPGGCGLAGGRGWDGVRVK